jgi:hypothetical protein
MNTQTADESRGEHCDYSANIGVGGFGSTLASDGGPQRNRILCQAGDAR